MKSLVVKCKCSEFTLDVRPLGSRVSLTFSSRRERHWCRSVDHCKNISQVTSNIYQLGIQYTSDLQVTPSCSAVISLMGGSTPGIKSVRLRLCILISTG